MLGHVIRVTLLAAVLASSGGCIIYRYDHDHDHYRGGWDSHRDHDDWYRGGYRRGHR